MAKENKPKNTSDVQRRVETAVQGRKAGETIESMLVAAETHFALIKSAFATEDIFFGGRSKDDVDSSDYEECERIAIEQHSIEDIVSDTDLGSLQERFRSLFALERLWDNLKTSELLDPLENNDGNPQKTLENIAKLHARAQIKLKKFYVVKTIASIKGIEPVYSINLDNFTQIIYSERDLRKEYIRQQIKLLFAEASEALCKDHDEFEEFTRTLANEVIQESAVLSPIPTTAPELYKERTNRKEQPDDFLLRVYEPWLYGKGLFRPHIKELDTPLYRSLYKKRSETPKFDELLDNMLPTARGQTVRDLSSTNYEKMERIRTQRREHNQRRRNRRFE